MNRHFAASPSFRLPVFASLLLWVAGCNALPSASSAPAAAFHSPPSTAPTVSPAAQDQGQISKDLHYLASDDLEGRGVGTKGLDKAADFIAARFAALHLKTVGASSAYFQPFSIKTAETIDPSSFLSLGDEKLEPNRHYRAMAFSADAEFDAPVVFAGYGVSDAERKYDDFANIDVKGKFILVIRYEPHNAENKSKFTSGDWSTNATLNTKARVAFEHGAIGLLMVNPPKMSGPDRLLPVNNGGADSKIPYLHITRDLADDLLKRAGSAKDLATLQNEIDASGSPQSFQLNDVKLKGKIHVRREQVQTRNVVAMLPGVNETEYVVIGAHYDHLGMGGPGSLAPLAKEIHNGADDNASGTTTVLALAEKLAAGPKPARSLIFALFSGEERGLLGSDYFVDHPPIPLDRVAAMLNLDMVGRVRTNLLYVGGGGTAQRFEKFLADADARSPLELKSIGKGGRGPSDHQSFAMKKIPVIFFFSGMHPDYHRPTDDADKINYDGIKDVVNLSADLVQSMLTMPRQQYVADFDSQPTVLGGTGSTGSRGARVSLGVVPDYGSDEGTQGVRISGTSPGSPAEKAGLTDGDIITRINDKKIGNLYDLTDFLSGAEPGQKADITVQRGGQEIKSQTTLVERAGG